MPARIVMIGSANIDFIMRLPHLPVRGETVSGGPFSQAFGGKGSNQAVAARRAGGEVAAVVSLGGDAMGREFFDALEKEGMDMSYARRHDDVASGTAMIQVEDTGDNTIAIAPGANELLTPEVVDAAEKAVAEADMIMLQMEIPDASLVRAMDMAAKRGVEVMLNYAPCRPSGIRLSKAQTVLVVNETEAAGLTGLKVDAPADAEAAARKLAENGHRLVVVTLGANGCLTLEGGVASHFPAFSIKAVDATAAGDSFCGALAVAVGEKMPLEKAIRFASAAGALSASRPGAVPSIPRRDEIEAFMASR